MAIVLIILGAICALYGVAVMMVGSGTWFFAFWYVLGAVLIACGWAVHAGAWDALPLAAKRTTCALLGVLLVGFLATQVCIARNFNDAGEEGLDYIIVLGAQVRDDGPSMVLRYRLDTAAEYLSRNPSTMCIVTGGQGFNEPVPEARVMADYLLGSGVDPARIIVEDQAATTSDNIVNSMAFFDPETDRVGIVTNNFHVFRGVSIARRCGIKHACGIAAPSSLPYLPNNAVRESFGIAKAFLQGNL